MLLTHRKLLQSKAIAIENDLARHLSDWVPDSRVGVVGTVENPGAHQGTRRGPARPGHSGRTAFACPAGGSRADRYPCTAACWRSSGECDEVCRRLMTVPGVGPVVALTYRVTVDAPARFQELQGGRGGVWADTFQVSVGRERPNRWDIKVRRRHDANDALRGGPEHAVPRVKMVVC